MFNLLVIFMGCLAKSNQNINKQRCLLLTSILGLGYNFPKELGEVWQILSEELGLEDQGLSRVVCDQLTPQKLGFSCNSQCRSFFGVL